MLITRDDIQHIVDEETLLHFLEEKLNLPIPEDLTFEDITTKFAKFALGLSGAIASQVLDCQELSVSPGESSGIILIRFNSESDYSDALRAIAKGMDQWDRNPADLRFICTGEYFQPFAFVNFNDSESGNWQTAVLNIRAWTQENTHIHTSSEHEIPTGFFAESEDGDEAVTKNVPPDEPAKDTEILPSKDHSGASQDYIPKSTSPEILLAKLQNTGTPLGQHWNIYTGITPGRVEAFVINETRSRQMISVDARNSEIIKPIARVSKASRWKSELAYLIWISSSHYKQWSWSDAKSESEAESIFEDTYPIISQHLISYRNILKNRSDRHKGKFYWELSLHEPRHKNYAVFYQPKIIYPIHSTFMDASYDSSESIILGSSYCIPTDDLSLLAILNSTLFGWYAQLKCRGPGGRGNSLLFTQGNMINTPIAPRTEEQKAELSRLVQQILNAPNSPSVPNLEEEINMLVYDLYELTAAEIALIKEETNK